jgi:hypothetical protein
MGAVRCGCQWRIELSPPSSLSEERASLPSRVLPRPLQCFQRRGRGGSTPEHQLLLITPAAHPKLRACLAKQGHRALSHPTNGDIFSRRALE